MDGEPLIPYTHPEEVFEAWETGFQPVVHRTVARCHMRN